MTFTLTVDSAVAGSRRRGDNNSWAFAGRGGVVCVIPRGGMPPGGTCRSV